MILLPLVWDASSLPAKQMPAVYSVKTPQEEGDIVKIPLDSDVFNGKKEKEKLHLIIIIMPLICKHLSRHPRTLYS